ncbi:MAG TPA: PilZ domain-containing protein [Candidatus Angelobacter sp.]|nr:PilZ domain-containing protein [Candidatus Angelobacter sp.]
MEPFFALLVSADPGPLAVTQKILEEHGVNVKVAASVQAAEQLLKSNKFDLGVFDNDVPGALNLVSVRGASANPKMVFALLHSACLNDVRGKRVHFVVQKPFTADLFVRSLRAAYGTMVRERRVAFRHPVQIKPASSVLVQEQGNQNLKSSIILDLSQNGLCIQTQEILPLGATLQIDFHLPEMSELIHISGTVQWTRASGRTGINFKHIPAPEQKHLTAWLDSRLPYATEAIPRAVPQAVRHDRPVALPL